jgi:hypothetical protein
MSLAYKASVRLYWLAKRTAAPNREFNVESQRQSVQDRYCECLRVLAMYSRTHEDSIVAYSIWGGRKRLGLKFHGNNVTIGAIRAGDIDTGVTHEIKNPFELRKYLENTMGFTLANLNEELFEKAYERLKKIEYEKKIVIDREETKQW